MSFRLLCAALLFWASANASAKAPDDLICGFDKATDAAMCIRKGEIKSSARGPYAPVYEGGSLRVDKTSYYVVADCGKQALLMMDKMGKLLGGGDFSSTPMSSTLGYALCKSGK